MKHLLCTGALWACTVLLRRDGAAEPVRGVHDPCLIRAGDAYYLFSTGRGIPMRRSPDLIHWQTIGRVFGEDVPAWAKQEIPDSRDVWAPDISFFGGCYHLYYAVSRFGTSRSVMGVATNRTLDPGSPDYHWTDEGKVQETFPNSGYNAIDANVVIVAPDKIALAFGSFWSGIKLTWLDAATGKPAPGATLTALAQRPDSHAVEAPFIVRHDGFFYLFVSFDVCCRGVDSTYNIRVGRAKAVEGPYCDRDGQAMLDGGGTLVLGTQGTVIGPGHCAVLQEARGDWLVHHFYDGGAAGRRTLQIRPLTWDAAGWPVAGTPLATENVSPLERGPEAHVP